MNQLRSDGLQQFAGHLVLGSSLANCQRDSQNGVSSQFCCVKKAEKVERNFLKDKKVKLTE